MNEFLRRELFHLNKYRNMTYHIKQMNASMLKFWYNKNKLLKFETLPQIHSEISNKSSVAPHRNEYLSKSDRICSTKFLCNFCCEFSKQKNFRPIY